MSELSEIQEMLSTLDPESRTAFAEAQLGIEAQDFFRSDVGRYVIGCAQQEYAEAANKLKSVAWWRMLRITELQNQMWRAEKMMVWLRDLIIQGKASEVSLREDDS